MEKNIDAVMPIGLLMNLRLSSSYVPYDNWDYFLDDLSSHAQYDLLETVDNSGVFHQYSFLFNVENRDGSLNKTALELRQFITDVFNRWAVPIG